MSMSLPERTVDVWVATAIAERFPRAELWAPTQNDPRAWDLATQPTGSKLVIFENKATKANPKQGTHRIVVDLAQLGSYRNTLGPLFDLLFYVLPSPPWYGDPHFARMSGAEVAPIPDQAATRRQSVLGSFTDWSFVIGAADLEAWLLRTGRHSVNTAFLPTHLPPLRTIRGGPLERSSGAPPWSLRLFLDELAVCRIGSRNKKGRPREILSIHPQTGERVIYDPTKLPKETVAEAEFPWPPYERFEASKGGWASRKGRNKRLRTGPAVTPVVALIPPDNLT
jgi:hypothetical protein